MTFDGLTLRTFETGAGAPIVFVHGLLVNANLWRRVVPRLASDFRCVSLDLPLGAHHLPAPGADLTPPGLADLIADAIEELGLTDVTLVGNDTGGALCQLVVTRRPERIGRLLLTSCDAYDRFPPRFFKASLAPVRFPSAVPVLFASLRLRSLRNSPLAFGWLQHTKLEPRLSDSYVLPWLTRPKIRKDLARAFKGLDPRHTLAAAERFNEFERPVTIAWSRDDRFFPAAHAERMAADFPAGKLAWIDDARTFSPEDQPQRVAELIAELTRRPAATGDQQRATEPPSQAQASKGAVI